jgi:hypothetical protein
MREYYVLNQNPRSAEVIAWVQHHKLAVEVHLNRTRFWVPNSYLLTEFLLRFADCCVEVDTTLDLATGLPISNQ